MYNIAIVEDEDKEANVLASHLERYSIETRGVFNTVRFLDAKIFLENYKPIYDVVFMDIVLPKINGLDASKELRFLDKNVVLIFVTNMANYAVKGYEVDALDFIIKPVVYESFVMKMDKALRAAKRNRSFDLHIFMDGAIKAISVSSVYYIEVNGHYLIYHTEEGNFKSRGTLSSLESQLEVENFTRCNVCYLVNLKFVTDVKGDNVIVGKDTLKISRAKRKQFINSLTSYFGRGG